MKRHSARYMSAVAIAGLSTILAACSSGTALNTGSAGTPASSAPAKLVVALSSNIQSLDPDLETDNSSAKALHLFGGTLEQMSFDESHIVPGLASKYVVSPDGRTYTFTLRSGLKFSNGSSLTSADVKASLDHLMKPSSKQAGLVSRVSSVSTPSPSTVVVQLKSAYPSLPTVLAEPAFLVMPASGLASGASFFTHPVSAGPYKISSYGGGSSMTLVRNPYYFGPKPSIATVTLTTVASPATALIQLKSHQVNLVSGLPLDVLSQLTPPITKIPIQNYGGVYIYTNNRVAPLNNVNVRQAIYWALNRTQINELAFGGLDQPLCGFWPSYMPASKYSQPSSCPQNVAKARSLLAGTPCAKGCTIHLQVANNSPIGAAVSIPIQQELKQIGITITIDNLDVSVAGNDWTNGSYQLAANGLFDNANIPDGQLTFGLQSNGGIDALFSGYKSPKMDSAIATALSTSGAQQQTAFGTINSLFSADMPYIPVVNWFTLAASNVGTNYATIGRSGFVEIAGSTTS